MSRSLVSAPVCYHHSLPDKAVTPIREVNCWPTPSNDGTCDVNIEYELENENVSLYDLVISIPLP
jgi:hypothetical protein